MDDIKEINPSLLDCSQKELAFIRINYPGAAEFVKNEIDFSEFLDLTARLTGPGKRKRGQSTHSNIPYCFPSSIPNGTIFAMKANFATDGLGGAHIQTFSQSKESSEVIWAGTDPGMA